MNGYKKKKNSGYKNSSLNDGFGAIYPDDIFCRCLGCCWIWWCTATATQIIHTAGDTCWCDWGHYITGGSCDFQPYFPNSFFKIAPKLSRNGATGTVQLFPGTWLVWISDLTWSKQHSRFAGHWFNFVGKLISSSCRKELMKYEKDGI